jgi:phage terminase large subunit
MAPRFRSSSTSPVARIELPHQWEPRHYQEPLWKYLHNGGKRAIAIWPRRHGKDDVALHFTACAAHERVGTYWHLLPQQNQARKAIWDAIDPHTGQRRIDNAFPLALRETTREQDMMIRFKCGSTWQVIGSDNYDALVGTPPVGVVFSEYALSNPQAWSLIRPILLENDGWALFITTPRGRNHAHRMLEMARGSEGWFAERLTATETGVFNPAALHAERMELIQERGEEDGEAIFQQEYMTSFSAGLPGAYYAKIIDKLEADGRIGFVPYNPQQQVHTAWDLGRNDATVIWFVQRNGSGWDIIDYLANTSVGIDWYVRALREKDYNYGEHLLPHDAENEQLVSTTGSIAQTVASMGLKGVRIVPRTKSVANDINEVRQILPLCRFDKDKTAKGVDALRSYRRIWDEKLKAYRDTPLHDWASDPADAFRTFAVGKPSDADEWSGGSIRRPLRVV